MKGMGQPQPRTSRIVIALGAAMAVMAVVSVLSTLGAVPAGADTVEGKQLPDLVIDDIQNLTEVFSGEDSFFNVTISNEGNAAYLVRTSGDLELFTYRDDEPTVASITRVLRDIYQNQNVTVQVKVRFSTLGNHTLHVVLDGSGFVEESEEDNNMASAGVMVVPCQENRPPEADGGNDRTGYLGQPMLFSARYSTDPDGDPLAYTWLFGDGTEGRGRFTNHTYYVEGQYGVSLIVSDGEKIDIDAFTVHVIEAPVNHPPKAVITVAKTTITENEELTLDGRASTDADQDPLRYEWELDASDGLLSWIKGPTILAKWEGTGSFVVTLKVSDGTNTSTATVTITVKRPPPPNDPPKAQAGPDRIISKGKKVQLDGEGSDQDGHIVAWEWDLDGDGEYETYSETSGILFHEFTKPGLYTLTLRVTDDRGGTATDSVIVTVEKGGTSGGDSPGPGVISALLAMTLISLFAGGRSRGPLWRWYKG